CSDDNTLKEIHRFLKDHAQLDWTVLSNDTNQGNCKTFNRALSLCHGKYIIDFAADDIFYKNCIGTQVDFFEKLTEEYGVVFCNVDLVDVKGNLRAKHYKVDTDGKAIDKIPVGDVYQDLVSRYFISPVGM